jgi:hypothetical protein
MKNPWGSLKKEFHGLFSVNKLSFEYDIFIVDKKSCSAVSSEESDIPADRHQAAVSEENDIPSDRHQAAGLQEAGIALEGLRHDLPGVFTDMLLLFTG